MTLEQAIEEVETAIKAAICADAKVALMKKDVLTQIHSLLKEQKPEMEQLQKVKSGEVKKYVCHDFVLINGDFYREHPPLCTTTETRLMTFEEIVFGVDECWFEGINGAYGYADCYLCTGIQSVELHRIDRSPEYIPIEDFGKKWRCWTSRPTDAQREAVKWND